MSSSFDRAQQDRADEKRDEPKPLTLIEQAISLGRSPEELGKLMDLQERYENNQAIKAFNRAMNACETEMPVVVKDRQNTHTRSTYATLDAVLMAIKPVYSRHGFSVSFTEGTGPSAEHILVTGTLRHVDGHSEQFSTVVPLDAAGAKGTANKSAIQSKGSSLTYARRYLTLMMFSIAVADEDNDGNAEDATLTEEETAFLEDLAKECRLAGAPIDQSRFFAMFRLGVDAEMSHLKRSQYEHAKAGLKMKLQKVRKEVEAAQ